jgi:DNA replication initiation complex subunit (GINS family)
VANAFKSGASQSRSTNDFNERAKLLSERLGAIEKPVQMKRANAPRRTFKAGPRPEGETTEPAEAQTEGHETAETETEDGETDNHESGDRSEA